MQNIKTLLLFILSGALPAFAQPLTQPKLVVGIVVDQMKYEYVYRYWDKLGNGGFKRLIAEGYFCENTRYNYCPTVTGPGHASVYTGATPSVHGIISNDWYDRAIGKNVYCVSDKSVKGVGGSDNAGSMSPANLKANTIGDELKLFTNFNSKVIGIALKDRGAILPAGHSADAAYWYDGFSGNFISSTFYTNALPAWVQAFNDLKYPATYNNMAWNTLLPIASYTESTPDSTPYESAFRGESSPVFPHNFGAFKSTDYENIRRSPFGNTLTKDFAKAAIEGEHLGEDAVPDLLCVSFSATDYIGHQFGVNAVETEDCYLRLDKDLEDLLNFLDKTIGRQQVLLFLTADHGAVQNPQFLIDHKFSAGYYSEKNIHTALITKLYRTYGDSSLLLSVGDQSVYINEKALEKKKLTKNKVAETIMDTLLHIPGIANVFPAEVFSYLSLPGRAAQLAQLSYDPHRSGDVFFLPEPNYIESSSRKGTTHGAPYTYDTHVPLFFWGYSVPHGNSFDLVNITDIAPTIAAFLHCEFPSGSTGNPVKSVLINSR